MMILPQIYSNSLFRFNINLISPETLESTFKYFLDEFLKILSNTEDSQNVTNFILYFESLQIPLISHFINISTNESLMSSSENRTHKEDVISFLKEIHGNYLKLINTDFVKKNHLSTELRNLSVLHTENIDLKKENISYSSIESQVSNKIANHLEIDVKNLKHAEQTINLTNQEVEKSFEKNIHKFESSVRESKSSEFINENIIIVNEKNAQPATIETKANILIHRMNEISEIIAKAVFNSKNTISIQLHPPEHGKIIIKLTLDNSGIRADIRVENPQVKEAIASLIPEIRSNLQSSGIKVSDFLLDLLRDNSKYGYSYDSQGQRKNRENHRFFEYFA